MKVSVFRLFLGLLLAFSHIHFHSKIIAPEFPWYVASLVLGNTIRPYCRSRGILPLDIIKPSKPLSSDTPQVQYSLIMKKI